MKLLLVWFLYNEVVRFKIANVDIDESVKIGHLCPRRFATLSRALPRTQHFKVLVSLTFTDVTEQLPYTK